MKALTVIQPWGTLLVTGKKRLETRTWKTNYRGAILIHAGMARYNYILDVCKGQEERQIYFRNAGIGSDDDLRKLPFGAILGKAELVNCVRIDETLAELIREQHPDEYVFGDFTPGRYAWVMENSVVFDSPIPACGKQGLWNWEESSRIKHYYVKHI